MEQDIKELMMRYKYIFCLKQYNFVWRQIYSLMNLNLAQMKTLKERALDSKKYEYFQRPVAELQEILLITFKSTEYIPQQSSLSEQLGYQSIFIQTTSETFQLIKKDISSQNYKINSFSSFYKNQVQNKPEIYSFTYIQSIIQKARSLKNMYLVRREFPQGYEISVTFIEPLAHWAISYGGQNIFIKIDNLKESTYEDQSILQQICYFWARYSLKIKIQQVKEYLKNHTIRGIISFDLSSIVWFESCELTRAGYKLAADGLNKLKEINLDTISKCRIQQITNQDHLHRIVEDFSISILSKQNQQFSGRSRVYFTSSKLQVQVILNILPFDAYLTEEIKKCITQAINIRQGIQILDKLYQQLKKYFNYSIPYPFIYYQKLYSNITQFVSQVGITKEFISSKFYQILNNVLYMSFKQISIKKYAEIFYFNQKLTKNISQINTDNYGPIGCKVVNFISFISCRGSMNPTKQKVRNIFCQANLHNYELESINLYEDEISKQINQDKSLHLYNFFLSNIPTNNQWRSFCSEHQNTQNNATFYQLIYICQNKSKFFRIDEDFFPISIETISNIFQKAYLLRQGQRLLKDRVQELKAVKASLNSIKNINLAKEAKLIEVKYDQQAVNCELVKRITTILKSQANEENVNNYYILLSGLEKYKSEQKSLASEASLTCLLSQIFFNVPTIKPQGWL